MFVAWLWIFLVAFLPDVGGFTAKAHAEGLGERIEVEGDGDAVIVKQDFLGARNQALELAKRAAFSRALEQAAPTPIALSKHHELMNELAPRVNEFLIQYRFEEMLAAGIVFVTVHAVFSRSGFREEFDRRGLFLGEGEAEGGADTMFLVMQGIRSPQTYLDILEQLPAKVAGIQSLVPFEIFLDQLTLKVWFFGDPGSLESAVHHAFMEIASPDFHPDGGPTVFVTRIPPGRVPPESPDGVGSPSQELESAVPPR